MSPPDGSSKSTSPTPKIGDVAQAAGVSPATVSRVLNGHSYVREEVRRRVLDAVSSLNYKPNRVAQRLRADKSLLIGIIVTDIENPFFSTIMAGIEQICFDQGYGVLMSNTSANKQKEIDYLRMMQTEAAAGLVIAPTSENVSQVLDMAADHLPIVIIDRYIHNPDRVAIDMVLADNMMGAHQAVSHLIDIGHRRIGLIAGPQYLTSGRERYEGYVQALTQAGLELDPEIIRFGDHLYQSGYDYCLELLDAKPHVTAIFVSNNMMTLGAFTAIHHRNMKIPDEVAIVGFDDMPWAVSLNPPLTTVAQPTMQIGTRAAEMLLERIEQPDLPARRVMLPTELRVRASCGGASPGAA